MDMEKQNAVDLLRESIRLLEVRQAEEGKILKDQLRVTYESLKPVSLITSWMKEISGSVEIRSGLLETIVSILYGYFTQKMIIRSGRNPLMKILSTTMQFGVANVVARNIESIRNFIAVPIDKFLRFVEKKIFRTEKEKVSQSE